MPAHALCSQGRKALAGECSYLVQHEADFDDVLHGLVPPHVPVEHVAGKLRVGLHVHQLRRHTTLLRIIDADTNYNVVRLHVINGKIEWLDPN